MGLLVFSPPQWPPSFAAVDWLRPVGSTPLESFIEPIRDRVESVELHFWETDDMAKQPGKRKKDGVKGDATEGLPPLNLHAAGIDVGSAEHYVAIPPDRDAEPIRKFGSFTADLHRMARWLKDCRIKTVVMQSTGVYWMALHAALLRSQSALGAKFRRLHSKLGAPKAITAMAHLLARLVYRMLKFGHDYVDRGIEVYEAKYQHQQLQRIRKQAAALHMQLIPLARVVSQVSGEHRPPRLRWLYEPETSFESSPLMVWPN